MPCSGYLLVNDKYPETNLTQHHGQFALDEESSEKNSKEEWCVRRWVLGEERGPRSSCRQPTTPKTGAPIGNTGSEQWGWRRHRLRVMDWGALSTTGAFGLEKSLRTEQKILRSLEAVCGKKRNEAEQITVRWFNLSRRKIERLSEWVIKERKHRCGDLMGW